MKSVPPTSAGKTGLFRYSVAAFLCAMVLLLVTLPLVERYDQTNLIESLLLTVVLISGVLAVGARRRNLILAIVLVVPAVAGKWLVTIFPPTHPNHALAEAVFGFALLFVAFIIWHLISFILRAPRVDAEVMCAGIAAYLMLGLLWTLAYALAWRVNPNAFLFSAGHAEMNGSTALYFSFITLTTVGYGDIAPVSRVARMLATMEAMTGTLFLAVLISRLVSLYSSRSALPPEAD
jgi:hypothetical protein